MEQDFETERLAAVYRSGMLDTAPEPEFDELVRFATAICGVPMGVVSLIDDHRQWFKASIGFPLPEVDRKLTFCQHTIRQNNLFTIEDARVDPLVCDNPFVTAEDGLRFYAGIPVRSPDGYNVGTLCVFDREPHVLNETQKAALVTLAGQVNARIELRMQRIELQAALASAEAAQARLEALDRRFKAFMDSGPFLSVIKDRDGRLLFYNKPFADRFHADGESWIGRGNFERMPAAEAALTEEHDQLVLRTRSSNVFLEKTQNPDGTFAQWRTFKFPCDDADGSPLLGVIAIEVTEELRREAELQRSKAELEEANHLLRELAATDSLTGLPNRRVFDERVTLEFARSRRKRLDLSVLMIDVDNFKRCNDLHGHDHGDQVLRQLADVLRECVRETDLAARYGGEEFVVLFPEADEAQGLEKAQQIIEAMHAQTWTYEPVTVSIGAAALDEAMPNPARLVTLADEALYAAKRAGKDCAVGYRGYYKKILAELKAQAGRSSTER